MVEEHTVEEYTTQTICQLLSLSPLAPREQRELLVLLVLLVAMGALVVALPLDHTSQPMVAEEVEAEQFRQQLGEAGVEEVLARLVRQEAPRLDKAVFQELVEQRE